MTKKKIKKFVYGGLGFPIVLRNVPTIEMLGEEVLDKLQCPPEKCSIDPMSKKGSINRK